MKTTRDLPDKLLIEAQSLAARCKASLNALIALGDANHPHRDAALRFFKKSATVVGWATCPLTENAFLRILGGRSYPDGPGSPSEARLLLGRLLSAPGTNSGPMTFPLPTADFSPFRRPCVTSPISTLSVWP